jgi:hypothetical protein
MRLHRRGKRFRLQRGGVGMWIVLLESIALEPWWAVVMEA